MALARSPLKMRLNNIGFGLKIPKIDLGIDVASATTIEFQLGDITATYAIVALVRPASGSLILAGVATDWINVKHSDEIQMRLTRLTGLLTDVEISGVVIAGFGTVDVNIKIYDESGTEIIAISNVNQPAKGFLVSDTKVRGNLRKFPSVPK